MIRFLKVRLPYVVFLLCFLLSSCDYVLSKWYGINELEEFNQEDCDAFLNGLDLTAFDEVDRVYWDSAKTATFAYSAAPASTAITKKDWQQPVQLIYLNGAGEVISYHANCYAPGKFTGLDWNFEGRFETFPPHSAVELEKPVVLPVRWFGSDQKSKRYNLVVVWSLRFEGITRDAVKTAAINKTNLAGDSKVRALFINVDRWFLAVQ